MFEGKGNTNHITLTRLSSSPDNKRTLVPRVLWCCGITEVNGSLFGGHEERVQYTKDSLRLFLLL